MDLLDIQVEERYTPPRGSKRFPKQTSLSQMERDSELNNLGREKDTEDFSNSPHLK